MTTFVEGRRRSQRLCSLLAPRQREKSTHTHTRVSPAPAGCGGGGAVRHHGGGGGRGRRKLAHRAMARRARARRPRRVCQVLYLARSLRGRVRQASAIGASLTCLALPHVLRCCMYSFLLSRGARCRSAKSENYISRWTADRLLCVSCSLAACIAATVALHCGTGAASGKAGPAAAARGGMPPQPAGGASSGRGACSSCGGSAAAGEPPAPSCGAFPAECSGGESGSSPMKMAALVGSMSQICARLLPAEVLPHT